MPRRSGLSPATIASLDTLSSAYWFAKRGLSNPGAGQAFSLDLERNLARLSEQLRAGAAPKGDYTRFWIHDPKRREILAPCFSDRVVHHAMMLHMGPIIDRALIHDTYACRMGKGSLAAVYRAQHHLRRFPVFVKVDVRAYFASIVHRRLMTQIARRFKHPELLAMCSSVLSRSPFQGRGLPIGSLCSQYFANLYLDPVDRLIQERLPSCAYVRYMDDMVWWCHSAEAAKQTLQQVREFCQTDRELELKPNAQIGLSAQGLSFLGFRIHRGTLRLLARRKRRYRCARRRWEGAFARGEISAEALQAGYSSALSITAHAHAAGWRRMQLRRSPPVIA